jgi:hypothetical protein
MERALDERMGCLKCTDGPGSEVPNSDAEFTEPMPATLHAYNRDGQAIFRRQITFSTNSETPFRTRARRNAARDASTSDREKLSPTFSEMLAASVRINLC